MMKLAGLLRCVLKRIGDLVVRLFRLGGSMVRLHRRANIEYPVTDFPSQVQRERES